MQTTIITLGAILLLAGTQAPGQELRSFGIYGDYSANTHSANFQHLPGVPNCCPRFERGIGAGFAIGLLYNIPLSHLVSLQLRGGYHSLNGALATSESTTVLNEGKAITGEFQHHISESIGTIGIEPMAGIRLFEGLSLRGGVRIGLLLSSDFEQREEISKPNGSGTFVDSVGHDTRSRIRNQRSGEIPGALSLRTDILAGISYTLPLNTQKTMLLTPEAIYSYTLTSIADGLDWYVNSLRLGVAVCYSPAGERMPPPVIAGATANGTDRQALSATVNAVGVEAGGQERPAVRITVEEFSATLMTPLLNYLFFDENSASIPERYQLLNANETSGFDIEATNSTAKLPTYHHLLNVIGRRLQEHPGAKITLTGCNQNIRQEEGNRELSRARAETVRTYLHDTWNIANERIAVQARDLPEKAANTQTGDGSEENRRVEIASNDPAILAPIVTADTLRTTNPPTVKFITGARSQAGIRSWQLTAVQNGRQLKSFEGEGPLPSLLLWNVAGEPETTPRSEGNIRYSLTITDRTGATTTADDSIQVEQLTISRKRLERRGDKEIDRYSLILFDVRSSELSPESAALIPAIRGAIQPTSTTTVTGYTDRLGDAAYNQQLADGRANRVAMALGGEHIQSRGVGQADLYDSSLPEGRLYTRTVDVVIETPVRH